MLVRAQDVYEYCQKHRTEAFIFGATNVGKSSVINAIVQPKEKATVSQRPGTTLGPICFSLDMQGRHIIGHSTTYHTTHEAPLPIFGVEEETVYDTPGAPYPPHLRPHVTRSERVLELLSVHAGTPPFQPPLTREAAEALPARVPHTFTFRGAGWKRACGEVTVAGVCSFVITYADEAEVTITVWAPQGVGVVERLPLELEIAALRGKRLGAKSRGFEARKAKNRRR
ncbi:hypothetical protein PTSG_07939 [Salpingoeca rosetta]|uniref:G domain-containing protein n=1 Tax=Salpingoeca rosetta (strain ATCC 50818 / BSB-021) TaxID=946362 RepID=F2UGS0_SALR5|nr:uncharacterized protein PTSG_07939 [Salpingoeca rosetta]EGD75820.1 hypothetical protein PTSG_07939 [Salpingoeca rosetta]|eukprot:XP_004991741.1 hypothetical protein PTSG_07939 [Salpingoeca rosetta]